jgi:serine/threonine protein kinase
MRHATQPDGTAVVIKLIRARSNELSFLQYLGSTASACNHTIPLLATFNLSVGTFIVIPEATPLDLGFKLGEFRGKVADLSRQLVDGVVFLHENGVAHLDIKPGNIVVARRSQLYIIDFDISVRVDGPDELIDRFIGTPPWMAPEIGDEHGPRHLYSPIRADLWSCGLVLRYLASKRGEEDDMFKTLAAKLLNKNPRLRPMLSSSRLDEATYLSSSGNATHLSSLGKATRVATSRDHGLKRTRNAVRKATGSSIK